MATPKVVTGLLKGADDQGRAGTVIVTLSQSCTIPGTAEVLAAPINVRVGADGVYSVSLYANQDLTPGGTTYTVKGVTQDGGVEILTPIIVPQTAGPFIMSNLVGAIPPLTPGPGHVSTLTVDGAATFTAGPVTLPIASVADEALSENVALLNENNVFANSQTFAKDIRHSAQAVTEAVLVSGIDASLGEQISVTLTADRVVGLPLNPFTGQQIQLLVTMGGTGGYRLTWPAGIQTAWQPSSVVGDVTSLTLRYYGTNWQQIAGQVAVSSTGLLAHRGPAVVGSLTVRDPNAIGPYVSTAGVAMALGTVEVWAPPPSGGDDTIALQTLLTAAPARATVHLQPGTYIVDFANGTVVGSGASTITTCLFAKSGTTIRGAGMGATVIQLKAVTRSPWTGQRAIICNQNPDLSTNTDIYVLDLTVDLNRQNQGPAAYNQSGATNLAALYRGIQWWGVTRFGADMVECKNSPDFGLFIENSCSQGRFGRVYGTNNVATWALDSGSAITLDLAHVYNSDAAFVVSTTATTVIGGGGAVTVTPVSMAGIVVGSVLDIALGTGAWETVQVTAVTGSTLTAYFASAHGPGSYVINDARFHSDSAVQTHVGAKDVSIGVIEVDYAGALAIRGVGCAMEIAGAQNVNIGTIKSRGCFRAAWIHNWTISATDYIVQDIEIGQIASINSQNSASGVFCQTVFLDDNALVGATKTLKNVAIGTINVRYGYGGAAIPNATSGVQIQPNVAGTAIGVLNVDGGYWGLINSGVLGIFGAVNLRNLQNQALQVSNASSGNVYGAVRIDTTGIANATAGSGIQFNDNTACNNNQFLGISMSNIPGASAPVDLSANSTGVRNRFRGDVSGNGGAVLPGTALNYFDLVGYSPSTLADSAVGYAGAIARVRAAGVDQVVIDTAQGLLAYGVTSTSVQAAVNARLGVEGGKPVLILDRAAGTAWEIRNNADVLEFNSLGYAAAWLMDKAGHFTSGNGNPLVSSALGTNITSVTPTGNDQSSSVAIVVAAGGLAANTKICHLAYSVGWNIALSSAPKPALINQTSGVGLGVVVFYSQAEATTGFDLYCDQALVAGTYTVKYLNLG